MRPHVLDERPARARRFVSEGAARPRPKYDAGMASRRDASLALLFALASSALAGCATTSQRGAETVDSPHPSALAADPLATREQLFEALSDAGLTCGGIRTAFSHGRHALMIPTECFATESGALAADAAPRIERVAAALGATEGVRYQIGAYVPEGTPNAAATSRAQAELVRAALAHAGLAADRLTAVGYSADFDEETYDGPATLAPGNPLLEIAVVPE